MQLVQVLGQDMRGLGIGLVEDRTHHFVDAARGIVGHALVLGHRTAQEHFVVFLAVGDRPQLVGQAPLGDHVARHLGGALDVVGGAGGDLIGAEDQLFGDAAAVQRAQLRLDRDPVDRVLVAFRQVHGHAQRPPARDDGDLVDRIVLRHQAADDGMAGLVVGGERLLFLAHRHRAALGAHEDFVAGAVEVVHADLLDRLARGEQRRLVAQVGQVGAGEARGAARDHHRLDIVGQRQLAHVHLQDLLAAAHVRQAHHHLAIETARTQQRRVEHVGAVGRGNHDHAFAALEPVHLHQQLVQGLLALVVAATQAGATVTADRIDFVDEDDARRVLLGLLEHVAHAAGADADEHLDEVGTGNAEERHLGLAGDGLGQQRLTGAGRADHQHAARDLAAELGELGRIAQEIDQLADFLLGLVAAGDVGEGDLDLVLALQLGARLAKRHRALGAATAALHLTHDEQPEADDQDDRQEVQHQRPEARAVGRLLPGHLHVLAVQHVDQLVVAWPVDHALAAVVALEADGGHRKPGVVGEIDRLHPSAVHFLQELGIGHGVVAGTAGQPWREALEHHHQHDGDDYPQQQILGQVVHPHWLRCPFNSFSMRDATVSAYLIWARLPCPRT